MVAKSKKQKENIIIDNYVKIDTLSKKYDFDIEINKLLVDEYYSHDTSKNTCYLDINQDGISDIKIKSNLAASSGGLNQYSATIETLNSNIFFATKEKYDTLCTYTVVSGETSEFHDENYIFNKVYNSSLKLDIEKNIYPCILKDNDSINDKLNWTNGFYYLISSNHSTSGYVTSNIETFNIFKGIWYNIDKKYIGLKLSDKNGIYYGWLNWAF